MKKWLFFFVSVFVPFLLSAQNPSVENILSTIEKGNPSEVFALGQADLFYHDTEKRSPQTAAEILQRTKKIKEKLVIRDAVITDSLFFDEQNCRAATLVFVNCNFERNVIFNKAAIHRHLAFIGCRFLQDLIDDILSSIDKQKLSDMLGMLSRSRLSLNYFWNCFYFSFSTFTTVGLGDWYPSGNLNRTIVMIEGALGWLCLGLFITTYANVLLR